ncbi:MAG TPA: HlyD family efflux transporter periplasmic adaptor subunit [Rubrobacter sp.]|nr:HlyD family efflux transporter periplasmic adaptor subunit [Rubrobacter sp.]
MQQKSLFRERAVDKMLSPDDLDRLMRVTDPKGWLALIALIALVVPAVVWAIFGSIPTQLTVDNGILLHRDALHEVVSQTSGIVTEVSAKTGDDVQEGQVVVHVRTEAGAEVNVVTLFGGSVVDIAIGKGMYLDRGQQVAVVEVANKPLEAVFFVPAEQGKQLEKGMQAHVSPSTARAEEYGYLQGIVSSVSQFPVTEGDMLRLLEDQSLVDALRTEEDQLEVTVELVGDPSTPSGFKWSSSLGPPFPLTHATLCTATFVLGEQHPVDLIFPDGTQG